MCALLAGASVPGPRILTLEGNFPFLVLWNLGGPFPIHTQPCSIAKHWHTSVEAAHGNIFSGAWREEKRGSLGWGTREAEVCGKRMKPVWRKSNISQHCSRALAFDGSDLAGPPPAAFRNPSTQKGGWMSDELNPIIFTPFIFQKRHEAHRAIFWF